MTLEHHRLARDATMKAQARGATLALHAEPSVTSRRQSSGESLATTSDPKNWYDRSNRNPTATYFDPTVMDVDPPFFQHETDSSNEVEVAGGLPYLGAGRAPPRLRAAVTQSSSADDYRSVIDDLTIENKRLKEELKRYKQFGPDMMKKEKLFEIKVHGLPGRKKRELEATLRDFAAGLENSSEATATSSRRKPGKHLKSFYNGESMSKHASSSSSNSRPVDSAYASMSATGQSSGGAAQSLVGGPGQSFHSRPSMSGVQSSNQKVENYLEDTPGGLMPRHTVLTDREKKKLVVRRLEQLFTGKISGRHTRRTNSLPFLEARPLTEPSAIILQSQAKPEAARESRIQQQSDPGRKHRSGDFESTSGDRTDSRGTRREGNGDGRSGSGSRSGTSASGNNISPTAVEAPEQRPTRPRDLDPDRGQLPSENMDYIRHLGLVRPEFLVDKKLQRHDVSPDADGWVYLNLLCNLAQLHIFNVTPAFIRSAVSEKSTKFQLSADGRKIRWRGGSDGTKFSSDSSGDNSQRSPSNGDESDASNPNADTGSRKKMRTNSGAALTSAAASSKDSKLGLVSGSSSGFHYKPIFIRQQSSAELSTDTSSQESYTGQDDDNGGGNLSKWDTSGTAPRKRRRDGAIIYYSGAAFCTDLSGDLGDFSPSTYMTSTGQSRDLDLRAFQPVLTRSMSGSSLNIRPLSDERAIVSEAMDMDLDNPPDLVTDDGDSSPYSSFEFPWCEEPNKVTPPTLPLQPCLEPCGLGGVIPEDHFAVFCHTRHPVLKKSSLGNLRARSEDIAESISGRLAGLSTASPAPSREQHRDTSVEMTYVSGRMVRLNPVALPPPAMFIPPFSTSSEGDTCYDEMFSSDEEDEADIDEDMLTYESQLANPHLSESRYAGDQLMSSSNDEEEEADDDDEVPNALEMETAAAKSISAQPDADAGSTVTSAATAGGELESGYSSSVEDNAISQ